MYSYLEIMMVISSIFAIKSHDDVNLEKKRELWKYLKEKNRSMYYHIRFSVEGQVINLPGRGGRKVSELGYRVSQRLYGFN